MVTDDLENAGIALRMVHAEPEETIVEPYKVAIIGSREFAALNEVNAYVRHLAAHAPARGLMIVSGNAPGDRGGMDGVDERAIGEATKIGLSTRVYRPSDRANKGDYLRRNTEIVGGCDALVAFWDGHSRGTADTIAKAAQADKLKAVYIAGGRKMTADEVDKALKHCGKNVSWSIDKLPLAP